MKKYVAGGRCGGTTSVRQEDNSNSMNSAYSNLLQQREQQESLWKGTSETIQKIETNSKDKPLTKITTIVVKENTKQTNKKDDIDLILQGDI